MDKKERENITARLKEFKDASRMTYRQIADEIGIEDITWSVIAHLTNGEECAEDKAETVESWLNYRSAKDKEIVQDNEPSDHELLEELCEEQLQMHESVGNRKNPQGLTALREEARRIVERASDRFHKTLTDAASDFIMGMNTILEAIAEAHTEGKTTTLTFYEDVKVEITKWR